MGDDAPVSDDEAYALLHAAFLALGQAPGATIRASTALTAARRALVLIQMGLIKAHDEDTDRIASVRDQPEP